MTDGKVLKMFKVMLYNKQTILFDYSEVFRYYAVLMRQRFDENKDIQDLRVAKELLAKGEEELFLNQHWHPRKCK